MFALVLCVLAARWLAQRSQIRAALLVGAAGMLTLSVLFVALRPYFFSTFLMLPILVLLIALPELDGAQLRRWLLVSLGVLVLQNLLFRVYDDTIGPVTRPEQFAGVASHALMVAGLLYLLNQYHSRLQTTLRAAQKANRSLESARDDLEQQVAARTGELQQALSIVEQRAQEQAQLYDELKQQRQTIRELSVPVLPISSGALVLPLIGVFDSERLSDVQQIALASIEQHQARYLLLDITGTPTIDSQIAQGLFAIVQASQLLGAKVALIGVRPEVAQTIVSLDIPLHQLTIYRDLESAIQQLQTTAGAARMQPVFSR